MTIRQTERARELAPCPWCAGLNIEPDEEQMFCVDCEAVGPRVSFGEPRDRNERWNLRATPQTSEEAVEAVARAIERADNETGYEYDHLHIECSDWGIHLARAAIAAMPSIPQESDAEVTEAMREAGRAAYSAVKQGKCGVRTIEELCGDIYTAMASARDREQPK